MAFCVWWLLIAPPIAPFLEVSATVLAIVAGCRICNPVTKGSQSFDQGIVLIGFSVSII
jgi:hypothetical protein